MPLNSKAISVWPFDELTPGATALDVHGGIDIAEVNGGNPSSDVVGLLGRARRVIRGGTSDQHFPRADTGVGDIFRIVNYPLGFAASAWVNQQTTFATTKKTILGKQTTGSTEWVLRIDTATNRAEAVVANDVPTAFTAQSTSTIPTGGGALHHIVLNYDAITQVVEIWFDGVLEDTATVTGTLGGSTAPFTISGEPGIGLFHDGDIDQCAVFGQKLTPTEIANLYNSGLGLAYPFVEDVIIPGGGIFLRPRLGYAYGPPELDSIRSPIASDITPVADTILLENIDQSKPYCFAGLKFFNDSLGLTVASPSSGSADITIETINSSPRFEAPASNTITAATPTTVSWNAHTNRVLATPSSIVGATHYQLVVSCSLT